MLEHADAIIAAGLWLSVVAYLVVVATVWNVWRRDAMPEVAYGGVAITQRRVRILWTAALVGATVVGSANDPVVVSSTDMQDPDAQAAAAHTGSSRSTSVSVPLPFYRYEKNETSVEGVVLTSHELRGFVLPTPLLWTLLAYLFLVIRFNPDSRWTRRFLHGTRRDRERDPGAT